MKIVPLFTEKTLNQVKSGQYTFNVPADLNKNQIKVILENSYNVKVSEVKTIKYKKETKKNFRGKVVTKAAFKKVIVKLKSGKLDMFEEVKK